jgi:hypothetical protein
LTSMTKFFQDASFTSCFFYTKRWLTSEVPICESTNMINNTIVFIPYYFRFMQCLKRFYENKQKINLLNAFKYFMCLMIQFTNIYKDYNTLYFYIWLATYLSSTFYSYCWDIYMDWGLLRTK